MSKLERWEPQLYEWEAGMRKAPFGPYVLLTDMEAKIEELASTQEELAKDLEEDADAYLHAAQILRYLLAKESYE